MNGKNRPINQQDPDAARRSDCVMRAFLQSLLLSLAISVSANVPVPAQDKVNLETLWMDLGEADAKQGHRAVWSMVGNPGRTIRFLQQRLQPVAGDNADDFLVPAGERLKYVRAIEVLERIVTSNPKAKAILEKLAKGPASRSAREAQAALRRLEPVGPVPLKPRPAPVRPANQALDEFGDPLPRGALLRIGGTRLRHLGEIYALAFSPDGQFLASGGNDGVVRLWSLTDGTQLLADNSNKFVSALEFTADSTVFASGGDGTDPIRLWDVSGRRHRLV
jgi:hypothetical protein